MLNESPGSDRAATKLPLAVTSAATMFYATRDQTPNPEIAANIAVRPDNSTLNHSINAIGPKANRLCNSEYEAQPSPLIGNVSIITASSGVSRGSLKSVDSNGEMASPISPNTIPPPTLIQK